jgi:hypothetical protein
LGHLWLKKGRLPPEQSSRLLIVLTQLRDLNRRHIATEDNEVFPAAAAVLSASDRAAIGSEMASRRAFRSQLRADPTSRFQKFCVAAPVRIVRQVGQAADPMGQMQARRTTSSFPGTDLGYGTRGNRARRAVKPAFSGRDLYQNLQSIGSRICDMCAYYFRERGKFVRLYSVFAHDVLNGDAAHLQSVSY